MREYLRWQYAVTAVNTPADARPQHGATLRAELATADGVKYLDEVAVPGLAIHLLQVEAVLDQRIPQRGLETEPRRRLGSSAFTDRGQLEKVPRKDDLHPAHGSSVDSCFLSNAVQDLPMEHDFIISQHTD